MPERVSDFLAAEGEEGGPAPVAQLQGLQREQHLARYGANVVVEDAAATLGERAPRSASSSTPPATPAQEWPTAHAVAVHSEAVERWHL